MENLAAWEVGERVENLAAGETWERVKNLAAGEAGERVENLAACRKGYLLNFHISSTLSCIKRHSVQKILKIKRQLRDRPRAFLGKIKRHH